jgi:hypothetical protein
VKKIAQNVAQLLFLSKLLHNFYLGKSYPKQCGLLRQFKIWERDGQNQSFSVSKHKNLECCFQWLELTGHNEAVWWSVGVA